MADNFVTYICIESDVIKKYNSKSVHKKNICSKESQNSKPNLKAAGSIGAWRNTFFSLSPYLPCALCFLAMLMRFDKSKSIIIYCHLNAEPNFEIYLQFLHSYHKMSQMKVDRYVSKV